MRKCFLLIIGLLSMGICRSQVGINTKNPQGIFHIDAKANTVGTSNISDDILVDSQGNLGIGTLSPKTKVDVVGSLSITNSNENDKYILTSNNIGVGTWQDNPVTKVNRMSICKASGVFETVGTALLPCEAPFTFSVNELNLTATDDGRIKIDSGLYLVIVDFDLLGLDEYGQVMLHKADDSYFLSNIYRGKMVGQSVSFLAETAEEIRVQVVAKKYTAEITYFDYPPFSNVNYEIEIKIIQLQ
ncbi:hypothetical protein [Dysgonomonas sp. HGC4]|uniref:hypothetical protein n=1 Tax=Dysgonomonas sp. HGC4 TaxID=1658009 RepID=UPI000A8E5F9C|nr:hypothetical protein [Dysgonomonas sp. HGC4]MBD8346430.1 hypothetical protein [Dysgonomonas sp. HGC4]